MANESKNALGGDATAEVKQLPQGVTSGCDCAMCGKDSWTVDAGWEPHNHCGEDEDEFICCCCFKAKLGFCTDAWKYEGKEDEEDEEEEEKCCECGSDDLDDRHGCYNDKCDHLTCRECVEEWDRDDYAYCSECRKDERNADKVWEFGKVVGLDVDEEEHRERVRQGIAKADSDSEYDSDEDEEEDDETEVQCSIRQMRGWCDFEKVVLHPYQPGDEKKRLVRLGDRSADIWFGSEEDEAEWMEEWKKWVGNWKKEEDEVEKLYAPEFVKKARELFEAMAELELGDE